MTSNFQKRIYRRVLWLQAAIMAGLMTAAHPAHATVYGYGLTENTFSTIAGNITDSIARMPGLLSGLAYMLGILMGMLGIMKVKDHVENPGQTPLKDGAIRMVAGGGLFALPIVFEAMRNTIGLGHSIGPAILSAVQFNVH